MCRSNGDEAAVQTFITAHTDALDAALDGGGLPGGTCASVVLKTGQTTAYGAGTDGDLQKGAPRSYTDNGDGTITDNTTGLMWEKKDRAGGIHDWGNQYTWSGSSYGSTNIMDGTITTTFLAGLNAGTGFAAMLIGESPIFLS